MSFGGQFGYPGELNPTTQMLNEQQKSRAFANQSHVNRASDYARLQQLETPAASNVAANIPQPVSRPVPQQAPSIPQVSRPVSQQPPSMPPMESIPQYAIPPQAPKQESTWSQDTMDGLKPKVDELGSSVAAMGKKLSPNIEDKKAIGLNNDINDSLTSDDPVKFANGISDFKNFDDKDLSPETPAGQFITKIDQKYLQGIDDKGNKTYECPLTKKPCGRKTFWDRLKQFFLTLTGHLDSKKAQENIAKYDRLDPITKSFDSQQAQVKAQVNTSNPWESQVHQSPYSNGGMY